MAVDDEVVRGRHSIARREWASAYDLLGSADRASPLTPIDLEHLATAAYLIGKDDEAIATWERAHHELIEQREFERAVRCAFWISTCLFQKGETARGGGWVARAQRVLDQEEGDSAAQGLLLLPLAMGLIDQKDYAGAYEISCRAAEIGDRFGDRDLVAIARNVQGRVLVRLGRIAEGMALLDEVAATLTADEVSAIVAGDVFCSVIEACQEVFDQQRAREWTLALSHWCDAQPDLVLYRGQCLVHRAEIMELHGAWPDAVEAVQLAFERFAQGPDQPAAGAAYYRQGELHRLRGEVSQAEEAYRQASHRGREPQPGLALLRLAQGRLDTAAAAIRRVLDEAGEPESRSKVLSAYVEIMVAVGEVPAARGAADELVRMAVDLDAPLLGALAAHASGAVASAEGDHRAALTTLRRAWTIWQKLDAPYQAARVRVHIALTCRELGDEDGAQMELDAARWVFHQLGALPDLALAQAQSLRPAATFTGVLTPREAQVLRQVAAGKTNRAVATELFLSEKTVARHISNIFVKLGLSTRSALTAYFYQHQRR